MYLRMNSTRVFLLRITLLASLFLNYTLCAAETQKPKYVFLMIGDGMGSAEVQAAAKFKSLSAPNDPELMMNTLPVKGTVSTHPVPATKTTDSAAAGTALACGVKTKNGMLGMTPSGKSVKSIAYLAKESGRKVAIISSVGVNHATPASFYSSQKSRGMYNEIGSDLGPSGFDFFAAEPLLGKKSEQNRKLIKASGYEIINDKESILKCDGRGRKILIEHHLVYRPDAKVNDLRLTDFVRAGIKSVEDCSKGFFMMVEGGKIDWAGHANDIGANIGETIEFDEAIKVVYDFYKKYPAETLVVVTADHETGGMKCDFGDNFNPEVFVSTIKAQKISASGLNAELEKWQQEGLSAADLAKRCAEACGLTGLSADKLYDLTEIAENVISGKRNDKRSIDLKKMYGGRNALITACLSEAAGCCGVAWSSFGHTPARVPLMAVGPGSELFAGDIDNTDVSNKLRKFLE